VVTWFVASVAYGKKLDAANVKHETAVRLESEARQRALDAVAAGQLAESARVDSAVAARLRELREELFHEMDELDTKIAALEEKGASFREQSNHDFAKEAAVANDIREITELCQRLLHTVGVLEGVLRAQGVTLGPGFLSPR
jgi:predicted RNase H-like nuclease (RuvC/YqgF family)